jgi:hypothetical protein
VTRGDLFQAKATLQAVIDNYKGGGDVLVQAEEKLKTIVEIESRPAPVEKESFEIDFNPSDSILNEGAPTKTLKNE